MKGDAADARPAITTTRNQRKPESETNQRR